MYRRLAKFFQRGQMLQEEDDDEEEETEEEANSASAQAQTTEQVEALRDLYSTYVHPIKSSFQTASNDQIQSKNSILIQRQREIGRINFSRYPTARHQLMDRLLPNQAKIIAPMPRSTFCGQFSDDGQRFFSACQDNALRLYDTPSSNTFHFLTAVRAADVGWSILDTTLSPDRQSVAYSTWSECIYMVQLHDDPDRIRIIPLRLEPQSHSFCIFSLQYSTDGTEIIGGSNDTCVYVYDLQKRKRILRVAAHKDDVNAVRFIDNSNSLIVSGSDDNMVSVWDRRALNESNPKPVGIFAGHTHGITFVHSRMDTRYLISNSKDQSIKLWDMRRFANEATLQKSRNISGHVDQEWDYRYESHGRRPTRNRIPGDPSVRTYRGHFVGYTLIRCYFSPAFTTGQKYIITGSSDGCVRIYDVLTGNIELCLRVSDNFSDGRERCVRDVSWHPYENYIVTTSWDSRRAHVRWNHSADPPSDDRVIDPKEVRLVVDGQMDSPPLNRPSSLRRLLIQQFLGDESNIDSDEDFLPDD